MVKASADEILEHESRTIDQIVHDRLGTLSSYLVMIGIFIGGWFASLQANSDGLLTEGLYMKDVQYWGGVAVFFFATVLSLVFEGILIKLRIGLGVSAYVIAKIIGEEKPMTWGVNILSVFFLKYLAIAITGGSTCAVALLLCRVPLIFCVIIGFVWTCFLIFLYVNQMPRITKRDALKRDPMIEAIKPMQPSK